MKTIARTALLGLLVSASLQTLAWAADPNLAAGNAFAQDPPPSPTTAPGAGAPISSRNSGATQLPAGHVDFNAPAGSPQSGTSPSSNGTSTTDSQQPGQVAYDSVPGQASWNNPFGVGNGPFGPTFFLDGNFGRGVGWDDPSYDAKLYYPWHVVPGQSAFFGVLEGGVTDFSRGYATAGFGYREYNPAFNRLQGFWGFLDYDNTHNFGFVRWGLSYENLGKYFDVRANWYILNNQAEYTLQDGDFGSPFFRANNIIFNHFHTTEAAFDGGEIEIGGPLPFLGRYGVNGYIGPYYVHSAHEGEGVGVQGRVNIAATDNFQVNLSFQEDPVFNSTAFVNVSWRLPDGIPTKWFKPTAVADRLNSMVWRKDRIPVQDETTVTGNPLLNPATDQAIQVIHVNPNLPAGSGNGTFEHPFGSLEQARLADSPNVNIILIHPRNDGTGTNLAVNAPFQLFNDQNVFGSTTRHEIITLEGVFNLPGFQSGPLPLVSNANNGPGSYVFALANRDQISGLEISGINAAGTAFGNGIGNPAGPIVGFNINQNTFINYVNAVQLENATGTPAFNTLGLFANNGIGQISNNTFTGLTGVSQNGFEVINSNPGNTPPTLDLLVTGNTATGNAADGFLVRTNDPSQTINATFTGNTSTANGTGYHFVTQTGTINLVFDDNTASNNTAPMTGVHVEADGGTINVTSFEGNTVTGNAGNGVWFDANSTIVGPATINVSDFQGNTITNNGTSGVPVIGSDPDGVLISATGANAIVNAQIGVEGGLPNNISNNGSPGIGGAGIHVFVTQEGTVTGSIVNNIIDSNVSFGINFDANAGQIGLVGAPPNMAGAQPFIVDRNTISANGDAGIFIRLQGDAVTGSEAGFTITNNSIINQINGPSPLASGEGIHVRTEGNSFLWQLNIEDNFIGIDSRGSAGPNAGAGIEIETFSNSQLADTVRFPFTGNNSLVNIIDNQIRFNGGDGINFQRNGDSLVNNVIIDGNNISNNLGNGINLQIAGGNTDITTGGHLVINFIIQGNNISDNGINGALFHSLADADLRVTLGGAATAQNTINGNGLDGVNAETTAFSQIEGTWQNNIIEQNGRFGISFTDNDQTGPAFNVTLIGNFIEHNVSDGINFQTDPIIPLGGGNSLLTVQSNTIKANGGDGVNIEPSGTSVVTINLLDNLITANTLAGVQFTANQFSVINSTSSGNTITNNGGDGVNMTTQLGTDADVLSGNGFIRATFLDNNVSFNGAHGFDILAQWNGEIDANIEGSTNPNTVGPGAATNVVDSNGLDGILVTSAADLTLSQTDPLLYFLAPNASPIIRLTVNQTEISGNGSAAVARDDGDGLFIHVGTSQFGFVNASVTNNHFSGNANIDFVTQSFTTTKTPAVNPFFNSDGSINAAFQPDPLARLALHLTGNVGNTVDVTRLGASYQSTDPFKTIPGTYDDPFVPGGTYTFVTANGDQSRVRNAQREPGVFNTGGTPIDGGALIIGGIWGTFAHNASATTPDTVAAAPVPTTTTFSGTNAVIGINGDYVNAQVEFLNGTDGGQTRVISATTATGQVFTVAQALTVPPNAGSQFTVTAFEQAGVGQSTFVTDSGPSVQTHNTFGTVISNFGDQIVFAGNTLHGPFSYTWAQVPLGSFGSPFP
jgi:hypothetical protein